MSDQSLVDRVLEIAKRRGFFWPSFEIYGGLAGFVDYGHYGVLLKRRIVDVWRDFFVRPYGFLECETPLIMPRRVFEASGHLDSFVDTLTECPSCHKRWRADELVEEQLSMKDVERLTLDQLRELYQKREMRCPACGARLLPPRYFVTMFRTFVGAEEGSEAYAKPEHAQGIFINFRRFFEIARRRMPFAVAQIGTVARNEISPRRGLVRLREFWIMELEFFHFPELHPCPYLAEVSDVKLPLLTVPQRERGEERPLLITPQDAVEKGLIVNTWLAYFMAVGVRFLQYLGVPFDRQRFVEKLPEERAFYSQQTFDQVVDTERWGPIEVAGYSYRSDYDLRRHSEFAKTSMEVTISTPEGVRRGVPHVVEPSFGVDRVVYVTLEYAIRKKNGRVILALPRRVAPIHAHVLPLVSKNGLPEKAQEVYRLLLRAGFEVEYDESGRIGRRYVRADEIGTPLCITIDYQTLEDNTVTLRDRDTWEQVRVPIDRLPNSIRRFIYEDVPLHSLGEPVKTIK